MGCGVSRPETDEGGEGEGGKFKMITRRGSANSFILDQEMSTDSKNSKTDGEKTTKEEEDECKDEEEKGDELTVSHEPPSFRIYCAFPKDHNDDNVADDQERNKNISDENKEHKRRRQQAVGMKLKRRFNNVKKRLIAPTVHSSTAS